MRITNSRLIKLPVIVLPHPDLHAAAADEANAFAFNYVRRTAIPTLEDVVIEPFTTAVKQKIFDEAVKGVGIDENGVLRSKYSNEVVLGDKHFSVTVFPTRTIANEPILSGLDAFLGKVIADSASGLTRDKVWQDCSLEYLEVGYLLSEIERLRENNSSTSNKKNLELKTAKGEKYPLDQRIAEFRVYLEHDRYKEINRINAEDFLAASSLKARLAEFTRSFEAQVMERYGVGIDKVTAFDYELQDGSAVRYLLFPRTTVEYGKVVAALVNDETENTASSTGDLHILARCSFGEPYKFARGSSKLEVCTEFSEGTDKKGVVRILRQTTNGTEERAYSVLKRPDGLYVAALNVKGAISKVTCKYTSSETQVKIDFFPSPPLHLR